MELNNTEHTAIRSGFDTCPSCKSDGWKSAKMVVMEGTTNTKGSLEGVITDPGYFAGGFKNFLASDKWFSYDHPLEAGIGLTSTTGLVEEIKRLLVDQSPKVAVPTLPTTTMPTMPVKSRVLSSSFDRVSIPAKPTAPPAEPPIPTKPLPPELKPWYRYIYKSILAALLLWCGLGLMFTLFLNALDLRLIGLDSVALQAFGGLQILLFLLTASVVSLPFFVVSSVNENRKLKKQYEETLQLYPDQVNLAIAKYRSDLERYEVDFKFYEAQRAKAAIRDEEIKREIAIHEKQFADEYEKQMAEYEQELVVAEKQLAEYELGKNKVLMERGLLWERARVCTRCGTAYLGGVEEQLKSAADSTQTTRLA